MSKPYMTSTIPARTKSAPLVGERTAPRRKPCTFRSVGFACGCARCENTLAARQVITAQRAAEASTRSTDRLMRERPRVSA